MRGVYLWYLWQFTLFLLFLSDDDVLLFDKLQWCLRLCYFCLRGLFLDGWLGRCWTLAKELWFLPRGLWCDYVTLELHSLLRLRYYLQLGNPSAHLILLLCNNCPGLLLIRSKLLLLLVQREVGV